MKYFIHINENKYVVGYNKTKTVDDSFEYEFLDKELENFNLNFYNYKFVNNRLIFDKEKAEENIRKGNDFFKIHELKKLLSDSDYKITKCYEASLMKEEMPYDYVALINERKKIRLDIADLEARKLALEQSGKEQEE
jgi:hypothetical protein